MTRSSTIVRPGKGHLAISTDTWPTWLSFQPAFSLLPVPCSDLRSPPASNLVVPACQWLPACCNASLLRRMVRRTAHPLSCVCAYASHRSTCSPSGGVSQDLTMISSARPECPYAGSPPGSSWLPGRGGVSPHRLRGGCRGCPLLVLAIGRGCNGRTAVHPAGVCTSGIIESNGVGL